MIIKALHTFSGILDLSSMERLQEGDLYEKYPFRLYIRPGNVVEVDDKFFSIKRIQEAIRLGYIEVGNINVDPNQDQRLVDPSYSGTTMSQIAGENLSLGNVVYYKSDGRVYKAKANSTSTMPVIGIVGSNVTIGHEAIILVDGLIRSSTAFNFITGGQANQTGIVYASDLIGGGSTQIRPSAAPAIVQIIGYAVTNDVLAFRTDYTYIEICPSVGSSSSSSFDSSSSSES